MSRRNLSFIPSPSHPRTRSLLCGLAAATLSAAGCESGSRISAGLPTYPAHLEQKEVLDVHVLRDETEITLTNSSPRAFGPSRLWVNQWFSRDIDGFAIGETLKLNLGTFRDKYGEAFRAGGFFATRRADRLVQVQIQELASGPDEHARGGPEAAEGLPVPESGREEIVGFVTVARNEE